MQQTDATQPWAKAPHGPPQMLPAPPLCQCHHCLFGRLSQEWVPATAGLAADQLAGLLQDAAWRRLAASQGSAAQHSTAQHADWQGTLRAATDAWKGAIQELHAEYLEEYESWRQRLNLPVSRGGGPGGCVWCALPASCRPTLVWWPCCRVQKFADLHTGDVTSRMCVCAVARSVHEVAWVNGLRSTKPAVANVCGCASAA